MLDRLQSIFPPDSRDSTFTTRPMAGKVVFVMLYIGAVEGTGQYLAPKHVFKMTDRQAAQKTDPARRRYAVDCLTRGYVAAGRPPWYAENTREPIRDETVRQGFRPVGAVIERTDVATNAAVGRYALARDFAELFDPALSGDALAAKIAAWQKLHLSPGARLRMAVLTAVATASDDAEVVVQLPDGSVRRMSPGDSSVLAKYVVEQFAPRFLSKPAVVFLTDSAHKTVAADVKLAKRVGLPLEQQKLLPDVVLVDAGTNLDDVILVFVEIVHSDGPVTETRRNALLELARGTKLAQRQIAFLTVYLQRQKGPIARDLGRLAWNSFVWFATEPDDIVALYKGDGAQPRLHTLLRAGLVAGPTGGS